jgi:galactonate dehydratase
MIGVETPDQAQAQAVEAVRRGFKGFKWTLFNYIQLKENFFSELARARECIAAARAAVGPDVQIYLECSEMFSPRTLEAAAREIEPYNPAWLEEPVPFENPTVMVQVQKQIHIPIATGERLLTRWEFLELIQQGGCRVIQPDVMHGGGLTELKKIASLADTYYIPVAPHNPGGPVCTLASMHLAASIPNFLVLEQMEEQRPSRDRLTGAPVRFENGCFHLSDAPGLGIDIDLDAVKEFQFQPQPVNPSTQTIWW